MAPNCFRVDGKHLFHNWILYLSVCICDPSCTCRTRFTFIITTVPVIVISVDWFQRTVTFARVWTFTSKLSTVFNIIIINMIMNVVVVVVVVFVYVYWTDGVARHQFILFYSPKCKTTHGFKRLPSYAGLYVEWNKCNGVWSLSFASQLCNIAERAHNNSHNSHVLMFLFQSII